MLEELEIDYHSKCIEVWNKIDLLEDKENRLKELLLESENDLTKFPIVPMSCETQENLDVLMK